MTTDLTHAAKLGGACDARVETGRRFSVIWLVPLVAGAVAVWPGVVTGVVHPHGPRGRGRRDG